MKKLKLIKVVAIMMMLLMMVPFLRSSQLKAQTNYPSPVNSVLFGTSDSRLTATIKQNGDHVTMTVGAVGLLVADVFEFNVLFNPDSLQVTDSLFAPISERGMASVFPVIYSAVRIEPALKSKGFVVSQSTAIRNDGMYLLGGTGYSGMHAIDAQIHNLELVGSAKIDVAATDFVPLYTVHFVKKTTAPITPEIIGFNIRNGLGLIRPIRWVYEGASITYDKTLTAYEFVNRNLFSFRSQSSVQTKAITNIVESSATLNGLFKRGELSPAYNLIDSVASSPRHTGKLLNDSIVRYGFFYTENDVATITHTEYSDYIAVNGVQYPFPTSTEIAQGYFLAGTNVIKIKVTGLSSNGLQKDYADIITGLKPNATYHVWAFAQYVFETSKPYPLVGAKFTFTTSQVLNIASIYTAEDPTCNNSNGKIQIYATGGTGSYQYSLDGKHYNNYTNGLITGLPAGSYRIYVRDANDTLNITTSAEIVLHNAASDLFTNVAVTNASNCSLADGILHVSTGGGTAPYTYTLNGVSKNVINGQITGLQAGVYVLKVIDALGCTTTTGEVHIISNTYMLDLAEDNIVNTKCNESLGAAYFTVTGAANYSYQLDGMSVVNVTGNNQIVLDNLNAGAHTLRVFDACGGEVSKQFTITNGTGNTFAVKADVENVKVACNGNVTKGSITLTVANGMPTFKYTIDGTTWNYFASNSNKVTIPNLREGVYYVQVADTNGTGCTYEINAIVIEIETPSQLNVLASYAATNPTCGNNNGTIQMNTTGGSGTYKYSVNGGAFQSYANDLITGLYAGNYRIEVQDANDLNCTTTKGGEVVLHNSNSNLEVAITAVDASTCSTTTGDGILYVSVSGGSGNYTYKLNGTSTTVVDGKIENKPVGVYVLEVSDGSCTVFSDEIRISSSASTLALQVTESTNAICGSNVGTATFKVTGSSNYSYQLDGMPIVSVTHNNPIILSNLNAGVHNLRVFDNCKEVSQQIIINNGTKGLAFTTDVENVKVACNGNVIEGSIFLTVSNGTQNYICFVDGVRKNFAAGKDTLTISVKEGVHYVSVEDATGCTYEYNTIQIGRETLPLVGIGTVYAAKDPTCSKEDGEIQVYATGGSGNYKYSIDGGSTYNTYANGLITGLKAGSYRVYVQDVNYPTCTPAVSADVTLYNDNSNFTVSLSTDSATTCNSNDGTLYVSVNGGSGNYTYQLNGISTTVVNGKIENKPAGVYTLVVSDGLCTISSDEVRIHAKASKLAITTTITNTVCDMSIGSVKFTVSGATSYSYQLDGMPTVSVTHNNPIMLAGLSAGIHTLRVFNDCGEVSKEITIGNGTNSLAFTAEVENTGCNVDPKDRSIVLTVTGGTAPYSYSIDNGIVWSTPTTSNPVVITNLLAGTYNVILKDASGCQYKQTQIRIDERGIITPPSVMTPQTFCSSATVANLQATGTGIKWYSSPTSGVALNPSQALVSGNVYYAVQTVGACESQNRSAVKVIINDNVLLDAPSIAYNQSFCPSTALTLADIATNGNTNIVWYNQAVGGSVLPLNTLLADNTFYYAAQTAGSCQSAIRAEVLVKFDRTVPEPANVITPQSFCKGALIANIAVPNNQIVWYAASTGGAQLTPETVLHDGVTYYAAYKTGDCQKESRTPVTIHLTSPVAPSAPAIQTTCGGIKTTLADLTVTGSGIVWYADEFSTTRLSLSTILETGKTYYAAQASLGCEGARTPIKITNECFTIKGTVFPFVHTDNTTFNSLFPIIVKLYPYPASIDCNNPLAILDQTPVAMTEAIYHDGSEWIPNTPINPGTIGVFNNPGLPIDWAMIGKTVGKVDGRLLIAGEVPDETSDGATMGKYALTNVAPADYLMVISRQGFVTRIGKITVTDNGYIGHRELIAGDVDVDFAVKSTDGSALRARFSQFGTSAYSPKYDLNGDAEINSGDLEYIKTINSANFTIYKETMDWLIEQCK